MAIFRGVGGSGDSSDNSYLQEVTGQANAASASASAASASASAASASASAASASATSALNTELTSASFNTSDGVLTLTKQDGQTVTTDLDGRFLTSYTETNDLSSAVIWADVPNANITAGSVTQHQSALSITESQISNLGSYLTASDITGKANLSGATFTGDVLFNDGVKAKFGTDSDLLIYHNDGEPSVIEDAGELGFLLKTNGNVFGVVTDTNESMILAQPDGTVSLFFNNQQKLATTDSGISVTGTVNGVDLSTVVTTTNASFDDDVKLKFGASDDLLIYHDTTSTDKSVIEDSGANGLHLISDGNGIFLKGSNNHLIISAHVPISGVTFAELYYNNSSRFRTTDDGVSVTGDIAVSGTVDGVDISGLNTTVAGKADLSGATFTGTVTAPNVDISTTGSVTTNIATGADNNNNTDVKVVNIGTGYGGFSGSGDSTTINMGSQDIFAKNIFNIGNGVTTANGSTINLKGTVNVDGNVNVDGKITGSTDGVVLEHDKSADLEPVLELQNTRASGNGYRGAFISMTGYSSSGTEYTRGVIGMGSSTAQYSFPYIAANVTSVSCGIKLSGSTGTSYNALTPCNSIGASLNNGMQCGHPFYKWNTVYATNGNIATSDQTHKRDVEELSEAETRVAIACKGLLRKYRWKDAYEEKGEEARIHFGIMAQDLRDAFSAEGLDASRYAMFCSDTWWEDETGERHEEQDLAPEGAVETTQLGVRYDELLAFIIAAI